MIRPEPLFNNLHSSLGKGFRLRVLAVRCVKFCQIVEDPGRVRMFWTQGPFADRQRLLINRLSLRILASAYIEPREVVEASSDVWMVRAKGFFPDRQGPFIKRLGLRILALAFVE